MEIKVRKGTKEDIAKLAALYDEVNDYLASTVNYPGWKKGVYPTQEDAEQGINEDCLYVATYHDEIIGSAILRHKPEPVYRTVTWQVDCTDEEIWVIYTLVVSPRYMKNQVGQCILQYAQEQGKELGLKALRLDVAENNVPAIKLYEKMGFRYIGTVSLGLECYGLDWFKLYEKVLSD